MIDLLIILAGAWLYRWRGMKKEKKHFLSRPIGQILFACPYFILTASFWWPIIGTMSILLGLFIWVVTTLAVLTGHGRGLDLGEHDEGKDETLEFLIKWIKPKIPLYWYDVLLLSITGVAVTLPAGIATLNPILAVSGLLKGPAYMLGKFGCKDRHTEAGELLTGAVLWGVIA